MGAGATCGRSTTVRDASRISSGNEGISPRLYGNLHRRRDAVQSRRNSGAVRLTRARRSATFRITLPRFASRRPSLRQFFYVPILLCADAPMRRISFEPPRLCANSASRRFSFVPIRLCAGPLCVARLCAKPSSRRFSTAPIRLCADSSSRRFSFAPIGLCAASSILV